MDSELQQFLEQMETRLRAEFQHLGAELRAEIQHAKDETIASAREMQTEVIRYIGNTAESFNVRMRHLEANTGNQETAERLRLAAIEERLLRIEMRVLGGK